MGRWAQRTRRGGGGGKPPPAPPAGATLLSIAGAGGQWILTFDRTVSCDIGMADDNLLIGDASFFQCDSEGGPNPTGSDDGSSGYVPGLVWAITSQPNWLLTPLAGPSSGMTV